MARGRQIIEVILNSTGTYEVDRFIDDLIDLRDGKKDCITMPLRDTDITLVFRVLFTDGQDN